MSPIAHRLAALLAGFLLAAPLAAQQAGSASGADAETERTPRYRVEVILFEHRGVDSTEERLETARPEFETDRPTRRWPFGIEPEFRFEAGTGEFGEPAFGDRRAPGSGDASPEFEAGGADERPPTDADAATPPGDDTGALDPAQPEAGSGAADSGLELIGPPEFRARRNVRNLERLADDELGLTAARRRLERVDAYRVLAHTGWEQDGLSEQAARPVDLGELGVTNPSGTLTVYVSRFVHLILDLRYRTDALGPAQQRADAATPSSPFGVRIERPRVEKIRTAPAYVLETQRRTRTGELHYIDHPLLGVLVRVTEAPEEPEQTEDGELTPAA